MGEGQLPAVGDEQVRLTPFVDFHATNRVHLRMTSLSHGLEVGLHCDIADGSPRWVMTSGEHGLRRLRRRLQSYLPERTVDLDEGVFRAALEGILSGPQPVLAVGRADIRRGLSHVLDVVTSDALWSLNRLFSERPRRLMGGLALRLLWGLCQL